MKKLFDSILSVLFFGAIILTGMWYMGMLDEDKLKTWFLGDVKMGETSQKYNEEDFKHIFDVVVGEMDVQDTSSTVFEREAGFCDKAYVEHYTYATIKYEVKTTDELFYVNTDSMTYFVSNLLGVTFHESDREESMGVLESNCVTKDDITIDDIEKARKIANVNFDEAVQNSPKYAQAEIQFKTIKKRLIEGLINLGFSEQKPEEEYKN